jgi:hypothetical protein
MGRNLLGNMARRAADMIAIAAEGSVMCCGGRVGSSLVMVAGQPEALHDMALCMWPATNV